MPRPTQTRRWAMLGLTLMLGAAAGATADAGPISNRFREWSAQRQAKTRVEKPFSHQSTDVNLGQASFSQKVQQRFAWRKGKDASSSHQLKTNSIKHSKGMLVP